MNRLSARFLAALIVASLAAAGQARADFMNWSYTTDVAPPGFAVKAADGNGGGQVSLTPFGTSTAGASSIAALAYLTTATVPVTFSPSSYTLTMTITDNTTGHSGNLTFAGSISGDLDPTHSSLVNTFATTQAMLVLDGHTYTVNLPSTVDLAPPTSIQQSILATVSVTNNGEPGGGVQGAPEPASLVLGGLGVSLFGVSGLWQRLRRPAPPTA